MSSNDSSPLKSFRSRAPSGVFYLYAIPDAHVGRRVIGLCHHSNIGFGQAADRRFPAIRTSAGLEWSVRRPPMRTRDPTRDDGRSDFQPS